MRASSGILGVVLLATVAGCSGDKEPRLMNLRSTTRAPDEFAIVPTKPLEQPTSYSELPPPTPGGANRTDPTPEADAVAALGGNPKALARGGIPASDGGLVSYAARFGTNPAIRETLAAEDLQWRRDHNGRILERLFSVSVYYRAYRNQSLDQHLELERWRKIGVRNVGAPPDPEVQY